MEKLDETDSDPADTQSEIGRRIHALRVKHGMTQRQVADPAYTAAYISTLESGRAMASEAALRHIAERLGVTEEELSTGRPAHLGTSLRVRLVEAQKAYAEGRFAQARHDFAEVADTAARYSLPVLQSAAELGIGHCHMDAGELPEARTSFVAAEQLLAGLPLPQRVPAIRARAITHLLAGELRDGCYLLERTIHELEYSALADPDALLYLYTALIGPYLDLGALARAARTAELALELAPQISDPELLARMHRAVARTLIEQGRVDEAETSLSKASELYQQLHIRTEIAHCHWMRGYMHAQQDQLHDAERELRRAQDMLAGSEATLYTMQIQVELADVLRLLGRVDEAEANITGLLEILHSTLGSIHAAGAHRLLGLIAHSRDHADTAEEHYRQAYELLLQTGASGDLADVCRLLGDVLRAKGDVRGALDVYRTGLSLEPAPGTRTFGPTDRKGS